MSVELNKPVATPAPSASVAPHAPIPRYYADAEQRRAYLTTIFDATASDYDKVERWLSLGSGRWYRRQAMVRAGLRPGMNIVDVAIGTGLVASEAIAILGGTGTIVGIDPSPEMLARAKARLGIETIVGTAESLPFASDTFEFVSMGYALRHMDDLAAAFREFRRVLKPGGRLCVLEITRPHTVIGRLFLKSYLGVLSRVMGKVTTLAPRTPELWAYYWETIDRCIPPESVVQTLREAGFADVKRGTVLGIFSEYTATKM